MSGGFQADNPVAAIFDLDGTLLPEPSLERRFFTELRRNGRIPRFNYLRWGVEACRLLLQGPLAVQHANKRYLTEVCTALVFRYFDSIAFFDEGIARVVWHARQKHRIVLLSGTLEPLAGLAATALECEAEARGVSIEPRICATGLAERDGCWTGYVLGEPVFGAAKVRALRALALDSGFQLQHSHAYGNSWQDRNLLCAVGHAHAVNPGKALAALANENDWPIWHWHIERRLASKTSNSISEIHIEERT